jgi:structural maintenance of chromosome 4
MKFSADNLVQQIARYEVMKDLNTKESERYSLNTERIAAENAKKEKLKQNTEFQKVLQEASAELQKTNDIFEQCSKEYSQIERKYEEGLQELKRLHELQVKLEDQLKKKKKEHSNLVQGRAQTEKEIPIAEKELVELKEREEELIKRLKIKEKEVTDSMGEFNSRRQEIEGKFIPQKKKQEELKRKLDALTTEIESSEAMDKKNIETEKNLTQKVLELNKEIQVKQNEITTLETKNQKHIQDLDTNKKKEQMLIEEEKKLVLRIQELLTRIQYAKTAVQESQSKNVLLKGLLEAQERGQLKGIIGRLGDLGSIDEMYDLAITNACLQLDSVVVQTADQANAVVEYMKEKRLGRASFTIMDIVIKKYKDIDPIELPNEVPCKRLVDLVRPRKPEYRAAFYSVLGNTLVVDDLNSAMKLNYGKKRYRVATLKGDIIEVAGTMTGGGRPRRGGMSANQRGDDDLTPEQILSLENELELCKAKLKEVKEKQAINKGLISTSETTLKEVTTKKKMVEIEIESLQNQVREFENKIAALKELASKKSSNDDAKKWLERLKDETKIVAEKLRLLVSY